MRRSLRWVIKGKLILQAPGEDADSQSQEREDPKEARSPTFSERIHSHRAFIEVSTRESLQVARSGNTAEDLMCFDSTIAQ
jgi:hypothetical protein